MTTDEIKAYINEQVAKKFKVLLAEPDDIKSEDNLTHCCCDFTAHCPVHGSREFDPDSYIAQG